jgi:hypothetical protein
MVGISISKIARLSIWESQKKCHLDVAPIANHKKYYKGEGGVFPQVRVVVNLMNLCMPMHQKCSNYALTNLLFGLVQSNMNN